MHLLIVHPEIVVGGAEKMLEYFLPAISARSLRVTVAVAAGPLEAFIPRSVAKVVIPDHSTFSIYNLIRQIRQLRQCHREQPFDIVHGWAARDWELTALFARILGRPGLGTLHDHPAAYYIYARRRRLMRWAAAFGLRRVVCVSDAVRRACEETGYRRQRLVTIHNGLPAVEPAARHLTSPSTIQLGYIGGLTPGKGIEGLLEIIDKVAARTSVEWELQVAGAPSTKQVETWLLELKRQYSQRPWWPRVTWLGWINRPFDFLKSLDLLLFTSSTFDSLPTVLLEAAWAGTPVLASAAGGAAEIVDHGRTGWLFAMGNWPEAAALLSHLLKEQNLLSVAGMAARKQASEKFSVQKMVEDYEKLYLTLQSNG